MSGPKTSRYRLSQRQRQLLLAQLETARREQEQKRRELLEQREHIKHNVAELRRLCSQLDAPLHTANDLLKRTGEGQTFIGKAKNAMEDIQSVIKKVEDDAADPTQAAAIKSRTAEYIVEASRRISALLAEGERISSSLQSDIQTDIDRAFDSMNKPNPPVEDSIPASISGMREDIMKRLKSLERQELAPQLNEKVNDAISTLSEIDSEGFLRNFLALTVAPLEKECGDYIEFHDTNRKHHMALCARYEVLCESLGIKPSTYEFNAESLSELESIVRDMEHRAAEMAEESYIADAVDEVMVEMGYAVLGSKEVKKSSGRRFKSELYSFDDGTAVNVTFSSDGRVTMELGGLSDEDRQPTPYEASRLRDDMEQFCVDYREIERRLNQRGVILNERIAMLPPEEKYAQIINVADYRMEHEVEFIQSVQEKTRPEKAQRKVDS